ncbi:hypothetical protein C8J56DRAFT_413505 [Mycena floridula]|nr:hypothetical protein C8J56DRAFT_413505 [Mycena floridula]
MWLVTAPFGSQDPNSKETRILKTGTTVSLGRKHELPLRIPIPKVSNHVFDLMVAKFSEDNIADSSTRPKIEIINKLTNGKSIRIARNGTIMACDAGCTVQIFDRDELQIANGVFVVFSWQNICCYIKDGLGNPAVSTEGCKEFGIHIVMQTDPRTTHHLTPTYDCTAEMADSLLLSCQFVKPQWLTELFRLANSQVNQAFIQPKTSNFRPSFAGSVPPALKVQALWEPSEERMKIFKDIAFLCIGDKGLGFSQSFRKMLVTGDGFVDNFNGHEGKAKWARLLSRHAAKSMRRWVAVADPSALAALGDQWKSLVDALHEHERTFVTPGEVITAVIKINLATFFRSPNDSVEVENPAEPPAEEPELQRALTRLVNGIDDPLMLIDAAEALATATSAAPLTPAAPRTGKLKHRTGTFVESQIWKTGARERTTTRTVSIQSRTTYKKFIKSTNVSRHNKIELVRDKPTDGDIDNPALPRSYLTAKMRKTTVSTRTTMTMRTTTTTTRTRTRTTTPTTTTITKTTTTTTTTKKTKKTTVALMPFKPFSLRMSRPFSLRMSGPFSPH